MLEQSGFSDIVCRYSASVGNLLNFSGGMLCNIAFYLAKQLILLFQTVGADAFSPNAVKQTTADLTIFYIHNSLSLSKKIKRAPIISDTLKFALLTINQSAEYGRRATNLALLTALESSL